MTVPDEAIEAAVLMLHTFGGLSVPEARERAQVALEAAAPYLRAQALEEVAAHLDQPRVLWWGDEGAKVADSPDNPHKFTTLTDWLRARAAAERGGDV